MYTEKINGLQVKVGSGSYIDLGQYGLTEVEFQYNKLWSSDSGRNLAGKQSGTLVGIFPKLVCQFGKLTKSQLEVLAPILDAPTQVVRYYDPYFKTYKEIQTYTGDWSSKNSSIIDARHKNEPFQISFIARERRQ